MPGMNGFNTLLMTDWFVGLYVTVFGEFKHSTISKRPVPCFSSPVALAQIQLCCGGLIWLDTQTHTSTHAHVSIKVSR